MSKIDEKELAKIIVEINRLNNSTHYLIPKNLIVWNFVIFIIALLIIVGLIIV